MKRALALTSCMLLAIVTSGQSVTEVQKRVALLLTLRDRVTDNDDSLNIVNSRLLRYLKGACTNNIPLLDADITFQDPRVYVLTSDDHKFRIYFWDGDGKRKPTFNSAIIQYRTQKGTAVKVVSDVTVPDEFSVNVGSNYLAIHTLKTNSGKIVYLATDVTIAAAGLYTRGIQAFSIENDRLNDTLKFFKTAENATNYISCTFDYAFDENRDKKDADINISLSEDKQRLYIPLINNDQITGTYSVYIFDGNNYVFHKNLK